MAAVLIGKGSFASREVFALPFDATNDGLAVIIADTSARGGPPGTVKDVENVKKTFTDINFAVWIMLNPSGKEVATFMKNLSEFNRYPESYKTVVIYTSSYSLGIDGKGYIVLHNGGQKDIVPIDDDIIYPFHNSRQFGSRQCVFLFDCCLKNDSLAGYHISHHATSHGNTVAGYSLNWRDRDASSKGGGIWTRALCDRIKSHYRDTSITDIAKYAWNDVKTMKLSKAIYMIPHGKKPVFLYEQDEVKFNMPYQPMILVSPTSIDDASPNEKKEIKEIADDKLEDKYSFDQVTGYHRYSCRHGIHIFSCKCYCIRFDMTGHFDDVSYDYDCKSKWKTATVYSEDADMDPCC